jgi:hypothetical protein
MSSLMVLGYVINDEKLVNSVNWLANHLAACCTKCSKWNLELRKAVRKTANYLDFGKV